MTLDKAREVFAETFAHWGIEIDAKDLQAGRGRIGKAGWNIAFLTGVAEGKAYLEYYASHRMTNDRHVRIWATGEAEDLPAIRDIYVFHADRPGDEERAKAEYLEHNRRVAAELEAKGLFPSGDINTFLRLGGMDDP